MVTYFVDKKVSRDEQQQHQYFRIDRAFSNNKTRSSRKSRDIALDKSKVRKPSEPECEVRVHVTSDCEQPQIIRRKSLDPTC